MGVLYQVRLAASKDLDGIEEIERISFSDPWTRSSFLQLMGDYAWVAESGGRVVGYLLGRVAADEAEVLNLAVHPAHRRCGIARGLVTTALDEFRAAGAGNAYLEVRATNAEAQAFYRTLGFEEQGRRTRYYDNPREDAVIMGLEIRARKRSEKKWS